MVDTLLTLDGQFLLWLQGMRTPILDTFFIFYTKLGNAGMGYIVLCLAMLCFKKSRKMGFWGLIAMLFGLLITNCTLKPLIDRTRPWLTLEGLNFLVEEHDPHSFPSGHSCAAFAAGMTWMRGVNTRWLKILCVGQAALMAFSRLYVGVHYPSDVLVGVAVGCLCAYLAYLVERKVVQKKSHI